MSRNRPYWISIACAQSGRIGAAASRRGSPAKAEGTGPADGGSHAGTPAASMASIKRAIDVVSSHE